jgi:putative transcriptional regulator
MAGRSRSNSGTVGKELVRRLKGFAEELEKAERVSDRFTCRTVRLNLRPHNYTAELVKKTRGLLGASQVIFAKFLGVAPNTVRDWEQGAKHPSGAACRIMDEIRQDPKYWLKRLTELSVPVAS